MLFNIIVIFAALSDKTEQIIGNEGVISRNEPGKGEEQYDLTINADGLEKNYQYKLTVEEEKLSSEDAQNCIYKAENEIDKSFYQSGDSPEAVSQNVNMKEKYVDGLVSAEWMLSDYKYVSADGEIIEDELDEGGNLVTAEVELSCESVKELYTFSFVVVPKKLSKEEKLIKQINDAVDEESNKVGTNTFVLPKQVDGVKLKWSEQKDNIVVKIIFIEILVIVLLVYAKKENEKQELKRRQDSMRLDYAEIVSKLAILLGAGMSVKQAWNKISARYSDKRLKSRNTYKPIYEEMLVTSHEIQDGIGERIAYQRFGERTGVNEYHRLSRLLVQNLQKGSRSICSVLEDEAENAYEQRRLLAKKIGEEAGTKMLLPLMLMMIIVIAIVIVPATLSF